MKEAAEGGRANSCDSGQGFERQGVRRVVVDVLLDLFDSAAFVVPRGVGKRTAGEYPGIIPGDFVHYLEQFEELDETVALLYQRVKAVVNLHYGSQGESQAVPGLLEHAGNG